MRVTDKDFVRVKVLKKGYALYKVVNARGIEYLTIDDEMTGQEILSSSQNLEDLLEVFERKWNADYIPHY